jgi:hypothetical protein
MNKMLKAEIKKIKQIINDINKQIKDVENEFLNTELMRIVDREMKVKQQIYDNKNNAIQAFQELVKIGNKN